MSNIKINELKFSEVVQLYEKINEEVEKYITENEMSINGDSSINRIFDNIARKLIEQSLNDINENFSEVSEAEKKKYIDDHLRRVEKALIEKMKEQYK